MSGVMNVLASYKIGTGQSVYSFSAAGFGNIAAPSGYSKVTVEAVGAGGGGSSTGGRAGAGGGAYAKTNTLSVTGGSTVVYYQVGTGGGINGATLPTDSWVNVSSNTAPSSTAQGCLAKCGENGSAGVAGLGGSTTASIGDTKYAGGNGFAGGGSTAVGGGGAGDTGAGGNASSSLPGTGGTGTNIVGGSGGNFNTAGGAPGGGGGGDNAGATSFGAVGIVRLVFSN